MEKPMRRMHMQKARINKAWGAEEVRRQMAYSDLKAHEALHYGRWWDFAFFASRWDALAKRYMELTAQAVSSPFMPLREIGTRGS